MTTPTIIVKLDDGTGTFPFDITSKVMALDGYDVTRGRDDWQGAVTAGQLGLTLNNSDGRFTPGSTILGTPSPITVDQKIRLVESGGTDLGFGLGGFGLTPFGGGGNNRFTGYVKSWPVSWPAVVTTFSNVQLTATDAQARAERRMLRSMLEEEILIASPSAYYTLGEAAGSTAVGDSSGNQSLPLTIAGTGTAPTFGSGTGPVDGLSAIQFFGGTYLARTTGASISAPSVHGVGVTFATTTVPAIGTSADIAASKGWRIRVEITTGNIRADGPFVTMTGPAVTDGLTHTAFVVSDAGGTTAFLFLDGVLVSSTPITSLSTLDITSVGGLGGINFTGTASHFTLWETSTITSASVATIWSTISGPIESGTARITRLAGYAGVPVGTLDPSLTNVPAQATSGRSAQDAIQEVADAEMGLVFIDGSGNLTFHNRARVATKTAPDLILDSQYVTPDVQPVTDDQQIINYFEATAAGTGAPSLARATSSETTHGRYPVSQTYLVQTDAEALDRANWIVSKQAEPFTRYGTLTINLYKMNATLAESVVSALDLNCWLRVTSMAPQNPGGTVADVVVQGWHVEGSGESWSITCNVVSRSLYTAGRYDDAGSLYDTAVYAV